MTCRSTSYTDSYVRLSPPDLCTFSRYPHSTLVEQFFQTAHLQFPEKCPKWSTHYHHWKVIIKLFTQISSTITGDFWSLTLFRVECKTLLTQTKCYTSLCTPTTGRQLCAVAESESHFGNKDECLSPTRLLFSAISNPFGHSCFCKKE